MRLLTAGESHGPAMTFILEGLPAGIRIDIDDVNRDMARRQSGYGRGRRMAIESDRVEITAGLRASVTLGSPVCGVIVNKDHANWSQIMSPLEPETDASTDGLEPVSGNRANVYLPRPGHADLTGALKYGQRDMRNILERASARETAPRVAAGAFARQFLNQLGIQIYSHVVSIGEVSDDASVEEILSNYEKVQSSSVRVLSERAESQMTDAIDLARSEKDSLGGVFRLIATGVPPGLGSHVHYDRRLDAQICGALMSIPAVKGVQVGLGFSGASIRGSLFHDQLYRDSESFLGYIRKSNNAGGIEGGISNGEEITVGVAMKPIPTLMQPLASFDIRTNQPSEAVKERSDVTAVPAAAVVGEAVLGLELASAVLGKFGGDSMSEVISNRDSYMNSCRDMLGL